LQNAARAFEGGDAESGSTERGSTERGSTEREAELLKKIGELTVERDFLSRGLGRSR